MIIIHRVKCKYCGLYFDRDKVPSVLVTAQRYAHEACALKAQEEKSKEEKDKEDLIEYIKKILNETAITPKVKKQLDLYINEYNFTYSGMKKALVYFYEVLGNDPTKANGGIGIIPYCYKNAYNYYYTLWMANQKNIDKKIEDFKPKERVVVIPVPERKIRKRKIFTFLDDEVEDIE